jgi:hypothetical protein
VLESPKARSALREEAAMAKSAKKTKKSKKRR